VEPPDPKMSKRRSCHRHRSKKRCQSANIVSSRHN
jgi:hypothetical protein